MTTTTHKFKPHWVVPNELDKCPEIWIKFIRSLNTKFFNENDDSGHANKKWRKYLDQYLLDNYQAISLHETSGKNKGDLKEITFTEIGFTKFLLENA